MNAKKSVGFSSDARHPVKAALQGVPFPISSEFKSLGAGVRTTDATCSGPLIMKRISRACSLLDRVHGAQGNFERRCDIISTMITATGLHAAEIVPLQPKDLLPFETKVMQTIWGRPRPGRAKEIFFTLLCKGHRIAPTLVLKYHRILWLSQLCRNRGAGQITAQAIWEMTTFHKGSGPYGRAMSTAQECGWVATQGWWGWKVPGRQEPLLLYGDKNTIKHEVREQLRSQMLDSLVQRRPRLFAGAHYTTCRRLVQPSIASFATELQRSILRGILSGATWTALRAYQRGMRATFTCPYCGNAPENEEHIFWQCSAWSTVRDTHLPGIRTAAAQIPGLPLMDQWPPCLRLCGLAPELDTDSVKSGTALAFMTALHNMLVAVLQARKLRDTQSPMLFMGSSLSQQLRQYPYHQLVGPLPRPEDKGLLLLRTPKKVEWQWEMPFLADLLRWLRELHWAPEPGTVTFLEFALDFEEFAQRTLPHAPQAKFKGTTLSLRERGRVLRLAMANAQRLVTKGHLHPARVVTRCSSLVPLGGPALCGLNCRPYFTCRSAMIMHIQQLAAYCERTWATKVGLNRIHKLRPYTHRPRRTAQEVEDCLGSFCGHTTVALPCPPLQLCTPAPVAHPAPIHCACGRQSSLGPVHCGAWLNSAPTALSARPPRTAADAQSVPCIRSFVRSKKQASRTEPHVWVQRETTTFCSLGINRWSTTAVPSQPTVLVGQPTAVVGRPTVVVGQPTAVALDDERPAPLRRGKTSTLRSSWMRHGAAHASPHPQAGGGRHYRRYRCWSSLPAHQGAGPAATATGPQRWRQLFRLRQSAFHSPPLWLSDVVV